MKKFLALLMIVVLCCSLCACSKNDADDDLRQAQEAVRQAEDAYEKAKDNAQQFEKDVDDYYNALDALDNYN